MSSNDISLDYSQSNGSSFGASEKKSIEHYLLSKGLKQNAVLFSGVFTDLKKKKLWDINSKQKEEEQLLVVTLYRIYVFSSTGGKVISDGHLLDLVEYVPASDVATLKFRQYVVTFGSVAAKVDELAMAIKKMFSINFPGMQQGGELPKDIGPCGGFSRTYRCVSDYYGVPPRDDICWEIDNLFEANNIKDLNLSDWPEPPSPAQGKSMIEALKYNKWFESIIIFNNPSCKISNDGILSLNGILQTNNKITKLILQNINARESWMTPETWMTMAMNNYLHTIDLSNNAIEDRGAQSLCNDWLATIGHEIQYLNISKCQIGKTGLSLIFKTMRQNKWILKNIKFLSVSGNKMEDSGVDLVPFLAEAQSLKQFEMADCNVKWSSLRPSSSIQRSKETRMITKLDLSSNKLVQTKSSSSGGSKVIDASTQQDANDLASFLQLIAPNLADVNLSSTMLPPQFIVPVLSAASNLVRLDLSDCDLGEEGIIQLVDTLCQTTLPKLKHLFINRNITTSPSTDILSQTLSNTLSLAGRVVNRTIPSASNTTHAANAVKALVQLIQPSSFALCPLETLHFAGSNNGRLRADIIPLAQALLRNDTIMELDIAGHHAGDDLAITLGRAIQVNRTLKTLYWDENLTTTVGLEYFSIGFRRNQSLQHMPLPVLDIGELLKLPENSPAMQSIKERLKLVDTTTTVQERVTQLASEIQSQIINNNLRKMKDAINKAMIRKRTENAISQSMKQASATTSPLQTTTPSTPSTPSTNMTSNPDELVEETL
ncbi:hypothetical protein DFA_06548 [Cavenderia fasciculata]|uniref:Leucine-rich repeat-containing protein n=1 Tax=Cavenderia fasciculata TaxID=261658 RepID=F4PJB2_CACFS|nr:uncharacterized protein DFA_06548 [Cavenderia fasciculata]EGG24398.1 hypothetical protein DFA_06548 [Cavenderia fasciculata]|eukprot:XP_004362249.1 hypothetical protein DFA_06548 [Cavenderia fasciculata]